MATGLLEGNLESAEVGSRRMTDKVLGWALEDLVELFGADACVDIMCDVQSRRLAVR
jgi:hypothetical protein